MSNNSNTDDHNSEEIVKEEARGLGDDTDFGEVQKVGVKYTVTQKGILDKDKYYIPKNLVDRFEDGVVYLELQQNKQNNTKNMRQI